MSQHASAMDVGARQHTVVGFAPDPREELEGPRVLDLSTGLHAPDALASDAAHEGHAPQPTVLGAGSETGASDPDTAPDQAE